jgi:hypothetical protein
MNIIIVILIGIVFLLSFSVNAVFAGGNNSVENQYFSIDIPDNWTYTEDSYTPHILLTPDEFSDVLLSAVDNIHRTAEGGVVALFEKNIEYPLKSAPLESYVKYVIDKLGIQNITSQHYTTVGKEKSVRIDANQSAQYGYAKIAIYLIMHNKEPYNILYLGNPINEKYLPEFEQIVKSFRFVDSPSSQTENLSETENRTNTATNFSGANLNRGYLGIVGLSLTPDLSKHIGLNQTKGFLITSITKDSPADRYGLLAGTNTTTYKGRDIDVGGDIILKIDNREVSKIDDIMRYLQSQKHAGDKVNMTILRDNSIRGIDIILGQMPSQPISQNEGNKNQEELYNQCVNVAGKSLCDFLFKR